KIGDTVVCHVVFWSARPGRPMAGFARLPGRPKGSREGYFFTETDICTLGVESIHVGATVRGILADRDLEHKGRPSLRLREVEIFCETGQDQQDQQENQ